MKSLIFTLAMVASLTLTFGTSVSSADECFLTDDVGSPLFAPGGGCLYWACFNEYGILSTYMPVGECVRGPLEIPDNN
jgi:hypothetical protein